MRTSEENKRIYWIIGIMTVVVFTALIVAVIFLYNASIKEEKMRLTENARSQARLLEVLIEQSNATSTLKDVSSASEAVRIVSQAHQLYESMGNTSEFTLARRQESLIIYLLRHRHTKVDYPVPVPFDSGIDEPMRQALLGNSGVMEATDYQGAKVLAAYEPVLGGKMGIVTKMNLEEVRMPFIRATLIAFVVTGLLSGIGIAGVLRISNPMIRQIEINRQRWDLAVEGSRIGVWDLDMATHKIIFSPEYLEMLKPNPGDHIDKEQEWLSRVHPDDLEAVTQQIQRHTKGETQDANLEYRLRCGDGNYRWVISRGKIIEYGKNHQPLRMVGIVIDITERKQSEEALRNSEARYRELFEMESDAIFLIDNETGKIIEMNKAAIDLYGYSREELLQLRNVDLSHEPEKTRTATVEAMTRIPVRYHHKRDGTVFPVEISASHTTWKGRSVHIAAIRDITERTKSEEILRQSEERYRSIVEGMPLLAFRFSPDGKLTFVNGMCREFLRKSYEELLGQNHLVFCHPEDHQAVLGVCGELTSHKPISSLEHRMINHADEERLMKTAYQGLFDQDGNILEYQAVCIDVTERRNIEIAMVEADKMATLGTLAAGIAHEINSPLQVIIGLCDRHSRMLANQRSDLDLLKRDLETMNRNGWRVANIVRSLLTYSRTSIEQVIQSDLSEIVQDSLLLIEHQLSSWSNISVRTDLAVGMPPIFCERNNISQVIINLLTNARDAMPYGGVITITTAYDPQRREFLLKTSDTGKGIPEEIRTRIFDPFFTTKEIGKGTGLGLSIVSSIVQAHGGEIDVESYEGNGTTFTIHLPQKPPLFGNNPDSTASRFDT